MLKARRALLEQEINKLFQESAELYLCLVRGTGAGPEDHRHYDELRASLAARRHELDQVNWLIQRGYE